jgi:hypothetical protein
MSDDLVKRLHSLHKQATVERSHFYVGWCAKDAIDRIEELEGKLAGAVAECERIGRLWHDAEAKLAQQDDLVRQMNDARDFPANTCGASRHAAMIAEALCSGDDYPMLAEEPDHCGESIAATVAALWECRTKLAQQDSLWEAFKHWEGERKYALRIIVKHLKNTPGSDAEGSCAPQADGSGEDS